MIAILTKTSFFPLILVHCEYRKDGDKFNKAKVIVLWGSKTFYIHFMK